MTAEGGLPAILEGGIRNIYSRCPFKIDACDGDRRHGKRVHRLLQRTSPITRIGRRPWDLLAKGRDRNERSPVTGPVSTCRTSGSWKCGDAIRSGNQLRRCGEAPGVYCGDRIADYSTLARMCRAARAAVSTRVVPVNRRTSAPGGAVSAMAVRTLSVTAARPPTMMIRLGW